LLQASGEQDPFVGSGQAFRMRRAQGAAMSVKAIDSDVTSRWDSLAEASAAAMNSTPLL
jgi:hypothetical protein